MKESTANFIFDLFLKIATATSTFSNNHTDQSAAINVKARPCTSKKITTHFIAMLTLLHWSGTETAVSEEYLQSANSTLELSQTFQMEVIVHLWVPNLAGPLNHFRVFRTKQNNTHLGPPES